jgi:hypothetical protein
MEAVDQWERDFALVEILAETLLARVFCRGEVLVVVADLEVDSYQGDEVGKNCLGRKGKGGRQEAGEETKETAGFWRAG